jgi:hypothetical protein
LLVDPSALLGTIGIVIGTVAVGLAIDRWVTRVIPRGEDLARPRDEHPPGTAASTAIACGPWRRRRLLGRQRCDCGGRLVPAADDRARLGERDLLVARLACATCVMSRTLYFVA